MSPLLLTLALLATPAARAALPAPELICEPEARIAFAPRWLRDGKITLTGELSGELPWTGHEAVSKARELRSLVPPDSIELEDDTDFLSFPGNGGPSLYVERELLEGAERDGLVLAQASPGGVRDPASRLFHCRSR